MLYCVFLAIHDYPELIIEQQNARVEGDGNPRTTRRDPLEACSLASGSVLCFSKMEDTH